MLNKLYSTTISPSSKILDTIIKDNKYIPFTIECFQSEVVRDEEDISYDNVLGLITIKYLKFCGCGDNSLALNLVIDILQIINDSRIDKITVDDYFKKLNDLCNDNESVFWFILYMLDHLDLIDHGSLVSSGWLTDLGHQILNTVKDFVYGDILLELLDDNNYLVNTEDNNNTISWLLLQLDSSNYQKIIDKVTTLPDSSDTKHWLLNDSLLAEVPQTHNHELTDIIADIM